MSTADPPILEGTRLPDIETLSARVTVVLGQNPGLFTGPGTNTYLVGTGPRRLLLDTGSGHDEYMPILEEAIAELGCREIEGIVLTHAHPDHIGGVRQVRAHFGPVPVYKLPWPTASGLSGPASPDAPGSVAHPDERAEGPLEILGHGDVVETEGARLRALFTPGHSPDHLCFLLEEERNLFSGDNVLGVGTTVIPAESGSLADYMESLECLLAENPDAIYPAHGPRIRDGRAKIEEYLQHRREREQQVLAALSEGDREVLTMVRRIYVGYPERLHAAAAQSITSHLKKLEHEGRVRSIPSNGAETRWEPI